jgi:hypothetical protein
MANIRIYEHIRYKNNDFMSQICEKNKSKVRNKHKHSKVYVDQSHTTNNKLISTNGDSYVYLYTLYCNQMHLET